jgi:dsDNA-specific endonuclease/ATPase MutS2
MLSLNDKVRLLHGTETGIVKAILPHNYYEVEIEDGFLMKLPAKEIVKDYSSEDDFKKRIDTHPDVINKNRKKNIKKSSDTVDLHLNQQKNPAIFHLSNGDIIDVQLQKLSTAIIKAMSEGTRALVIIHGVGNGTLKNKVHEFVKKNRLVKNISTADYKKYGSGATLITF